MRTAPLCLALACLAGSALAAPPKSAGAFPYPTKVSRLPNGLTLVRVPMATPGILAYYTVVRVGSRNEVEAGHTGFAHFFEHMMFRGTKRFPGNSRSATLGKLGFNENAFTADDVTVYTINGPSSGLDTLVELEADRFRHLDYAEGPFQTEARSVEGEYQKNASNPGLKIEEALLGAAFTTHPYRHTTLGYLEDIQAMPTRFDYSKTFFARWYTPDNTVVIVAGDFDDAKLLAVVTEQYGPWQGKAATLAIPPEPPQKEARSVTVTWPTPTLPRHGLAWHTPAASTKTLDAAVQDVLAAYLVGPTSPLHRTFVLERQQVERFSSFYEHHRDPGLFGLDAKLKDEAHRDAVEQAMLAELATLAAGKVDGQRLSDIKDHLRYRLLLELETPAQVAQVLAWHLGIFGSPDALDTLFANIAKVSPRDLTAFTKKHLVDTNRTTLRFVVAPKGATP